MLFGLKPSLRMAALKMLTCKKKKISFSEHDKDEVEGNIIFIKLIGNKVINDVWKYFEKSWNI